MGETGLLSSTVVFVTLPRFHIVNYNVPSGKGRKDKIRIARAKMYSIIAERKVTGALTKNVPSSADRNYEPNDKVLIYDEQSNR